MFHFINNWTFVIPEIGLYVADIQIYACSIDIHSELSAKYNKTTNIECVFRKEVHYLNFY
jgi:hypothetical protein